MVYNPNPKYTIEGNEYVQNDKMYTLFKCPMLNYQFDTYKDIVTKERKDCFKIMGSVDCCVSWQWCRDLGFKQTFSEQNGTYSYIKDENF